MSVTLDGGDAFNVVPVLPDQPQDLRSRDTAEWEFWATPTAGGTHDLQVIVLLYNNQAYLPVARFSQSISVDVPFLSQVASVLDGGPKEFAELFVAGLLSILAAGWYERRLRSKEARSGRPSHSAGDDASG